MFIYIQTCPLQRIFLSYPIVQFSRLSVSCTDIVRKRSHDCVRRTMSWRQSFVFFARAKTRLVFICLLYGISSLIVFEHFFVVKWQQLDKVLIDGETTNYWQKHIIPPIEFGFMHLLLLGLAVIPLTMCRKIIFHVSKTWANRYLPVDSLVSVHTFFGWWMAVQLVVATIVFFAHFGSLCGQHKSGTETVDFCVNMSSEIMITGLCILGVTCIMFGTAILPVRRRIPYEVFYYTHHLFVPLYILAIIHTIDAKTRRADVQSRSQNFFWFIVPALLYVIDRCVLRSLCTKKVCITRAKLLHEPDTIVLRIQRPANFDYLPGQWAKISVPLLHSPLQWHAFSISSSPHNEDELEFIITVIKGGWTAKLFNLLLRAQEDDGLLVEIEVQGPYGGALQGALRMPNVALFSTGTGIVPMLSLLRTISAASRDSMSWKESLAGFAGNRPCASLTEDNGVEYSQELSTLSRSEDGFTKTRAQFGRLKSLYINSSLIEDSGKDAGGEQSSNGIGKRLDATLVFRQWTKKLRDATEHLSEKNASVQKFLSSPSALLYTWTDIKFSHMLYREATKRTGLCLVSLLTGCLQFLLVFLEISYWSNDVSQSWPWIITNSLTIVSLVGLLATNVFSWYVSKLCASGASDADKDEDRLNLSGRAKRIVRGSLQIPSIPGATVYQMIQNLILVGAMGAVVGVYWGEEYPDGMMLALMCLLRLLQMLYHFGTNPLFLLNGPENLRSFCSNAFFLQNVQVQWVTSSTEAFLWVFEELVETLETIKASVGQDSIRSVQVKISITKTTDEDKLFVQNLIRGTSLEGCVEFSRPDMDADLRSICDEHLDHSDHYTIPGINVCFCGNPGAAHVLHNAIGKIHVDPKYKNLVVAHSTETVFS